jgi:hypothetical protein
MDVDAHAQVTHRNWTSQDGSTTRVLPILTHMSSPIVCGEPRWCDWRPIEQCRYAVVKRMLLRICHVWLVGDIANVLMAFLYDREQATVHMVVDLKSRLSFAFDHAVLRNKERDIYPEFARIMREYKQRVAAFSNTHIKAIARGIPTRLFTCSLDHSGGVVFVRRNKDNSGGEVYLHGNKIVVEVWAMSVLTYSMHHFSPPERYECRVEVECEGALVDVRAKITH